MSNYTRSPLKWMGGKYGILDQILPVINQFKKANSRLVEPFCGGCSVSLNADFDKYLLNDANQHLINFWRFLISKKSSVNLIKMMFDAETNTENFYYGVRDGFNGLREDYPIKDHDPVDFIYLNRHCFNGRWRVNSKGHMNIGYGHYKSPYFPENELKFSYDHFANRASFSLQNYKILIADSQENDVIYCDPPYHGTETGYTSESFTWSDQIELALLAKRCNQPVIISNIDTPEMRALYQDADQIIEISKGCSVGGKGAKRGQRKELVAIYG